jgi:O-antigen/teichoic acid export membrane protein
LPYHPHVVLLQLESGLLETAEAGIREEKKNPQFHGRPILRTARGSESVERRDHSRVAARAEQALHELIRFVGPGVALRPILTIGISVLVARTLGPEGRGAYGVVVTAVAVLPLVCGFGFESAVRYWSARGEVEPRSILRTATALGMLQSALVGGVGVVCVTLRSPDWLVPESIGLLSATALCMGLGFSSLKSLWGNFLVGQERYGFTTWGNNIATALQLCVLVAWWQLAGMSLDAALFALGVQTVVALPLFLAFAARDFGRALRAPFVGRGDLRQMVGFGVWQWLGALLTQTNLRLNVFLLAALGGLHETGLYTAVLGPAQFLLLLTSPLNLVLSARTARRSDDLDFPQRVAAAMRLVLVISAVPALVGAVLATPVLPWVFGERFVDAVPAFRLLLPGVVAMSLIQLMAQYLVGTRRPEWNTWVAGAGAVLTVALNLLLIPSYGASGAALATSIALLTTLLVSVFAFLRVSRLPLRDLLAFRGSDWLPLARVLRLPRKNAL